MPPSSVAPAAGEGGHPTGEVGPATIVVTVSLNAHSSVLRSRRRGPIRNLKKSC